MNFQADVFIIPNTIGTFKKEEHNHLNAKLARWGFSERFKEGDTIIQIWIASDASDNWADHGAPQEIFNLLEPTGKNYFPQYFPASIFQNKKEGETVDLMLEGVHQLTLTCNQLNYRYKNFGNFEDAYNYVA